MSEEAASTAVAEVDEHLDSARDLDGSGAGPVHGADHGGHDDHPDDRSYVGIAIFLGILTAIEVSTYWPFGNFFEQNHGLMIALLTVLMVVKFATVAGYFMHLKVDSAVYRWLFVFGILVALAVFFAVMFSMNLFG